MPFHVFVEGPVDPSPNATMQLASAMAKRYGLPETELSSRLARGRFRVKANIDRSLADTYARDLVALGARVTITDAETGAAIPSPDDAAPAAQIGGSASGSYRAARPSSDAIPSTRLRAVGAAHPATSARAATPPAGVARTATPPAGVAARPSLDAASRRDSAPPANRNGLEAAVAPPTRTPATGIRTGLDAAAGPTPSRTATPPSGLAAAVSSGLAAAGVPTRPSNPQVSSGLAAASGYSEQSEQLDFGALGDDRAFSLSSVDGADESPATANELFAPPPADDAAFPASIGPAMTPTPAAKPKAEPSGPVDLFAPPEAADDRRSDFAIDDEVHRNRESTPPQNVDAASSGPLPTTPSSARVPVVTAEPAKPRPKAPMSRNRFLAGLAFAIVVGFLPAHLVASAKESKLAEIDEQVVKFQQNRDNTEADVDAFRAGRLAEKQSQQSSIALTGMLVWLVAGAALGFAWTRIPFGREG